MRGNIAQLMQQAQKMQENMQRVQEELASLEVTGKAGGGMVEVTLTGRMECRKVRIDPGGCRRWTASARANSGCTAWPTACQTAKSRN